MSFDLVMLNWFIAVFARPRGYWVSGAMLLTYVFVALEPFHWLPPRITANGVLALNQGFRFPEPGIARFGAPDWIEDAVIQDQFKLDLRVRALSSSQLGPARIFTLSADPGARNVTVSQDGKDMSVRLRTPQTSLNGLPGYTVPGVFETLAWREITLAVERELLTITINEEPVLRERLPARPLSTWNRQFRLAIGNELTGDRPWLGEISRATVSVGGKEFDCLTQESLETPSEYWVGLKSHSDLASVYHKRAWKDIILNLVCFIPLGFVLVLNRAPRGSLIWAVSICAVASLIIEISQICFDERVPSVVDWVANVIGAIAGAWMARCVIVKSRQRLETFPPLT